MQAGRLLIKRLHKTISENKDIAFESTMAGPSWESLINKVKMLNYNITLCYNAVKNPKISVERVDKRVLEGGHFIPHNVIKRRYKRSLFFLNYIKTYVINGTFLIIQIIVQFYWSIKKMVIMLKC
ncbi:MAG: zeta toxin family protein [Bdellovibrionales bacterium]|nr:zeta toxin family protein [Bdellovibrionales bacterium]